MFILGLVEGEPRDAIRRGQGVARGKSRSCVDMVTLKEMIP
jgi:hypothetical protein